VSTSLHFFTLIQAGGVLPLREEYDKHFEIVSAKGCNLVRVQQLWGQTLRVPVITEM